MHVTIYIQYYYYYTIYIAVYIRTMLVFRIVIDEFGLL